MSEITERGFTVKINKNHTTKYIAPSKHPISGNVVNVALGFNLEPWQTIVLLPDEVEKLTEALNTYLETENG